MEGRKRLLLRVEELKYIREAGELRTSGFENAVSVT